MDDHTIEFSVEYLPTFTNISLQNHPGLWLNGAFFIAPGSAQAACGAEGDGAQNGGTGGAQGSAGKEGTDGWDLN